jgi:hypothetical protein
VGGQQTKPHEAGVFETHADPDGQAGPLPQRQVGGAALSSQN